MAKSRPRKPYTGILTVPTPQSGAVEMMNRKMDALLEHYGLEGDRWFRLAAELAKEHVPGFAPPPLKHPQGQRPKRSSGEIDPLLYFELKSAEERGDLVSNEARFLKLRHPDHPISKKSADTLRKRYYLLRDPDSKEGQLLRMFFDHAGVNERQEIEKITALRKK